MCFKLGIDVGSTTLKTVVLDEDGKIREKSYQRHFSKVREVTLAHLQSLEPLLRGRDIHVAVTGSAGLGLARQSGLAFVQEVFATAGAVRRALPKTDVVIELGGEDAKILFLKGTLEERMNGTCAGGTGAFIDQMATLLNMTPAELDDLSFRHERIYPIASRCGVFAKSDIQPLLNQGARKEDIAASIFQAVVEQTITGLAQGRKIQGNVLFLGGPLSFLHGLRERFVKTLKLAPEHAQFPALGPYFVALGCAWYAEGLDEGHTIGDIIAKLSDMPAVSDGLGRRPPLFETPDEYAAFRKRHAAVTAAHADLEHYTGRAYLGIDAGSTTTKLVLIGEDAEILYEYYTGNGGNPVPVVRGQLANIRELCGGRVEIASSAVTGYGEDLMRHAFGVDFGIVETVAHYTAARHFNPAVDFIIDIGGQDMKCFHIRDNTVDSVILNEACSSGCGSFIETFAKSLGYPVDKFAKLALFSKAPADLGSRCTVFMNSSVKQAQKDGATVEDISAGLAISVIKNAVYKVIRAKNTAELGENIVVQGGTFLNDAILRSFEQELGHEVVRPAIAALMGAFGAALYAREHAPDESGLISSGALAAFTHSAVPAVCRRCTNKCSLTVNKFSDGGQLVSGNRCERGAGHEQAEHLPSLVRYKYEYLESISLNGGQRARIGLPLVLNNYELLPFWAAFFCSLGCEIVLSGPSTRALYMRGQDTIPSDTVCYPAKLAHGHIADLLHEDLDAIFYPCMSYNVDEQISDNHYNCPVVAYYPELVRANMLGDSQVRFIAPHISVENPAYFAKRIFGELQGTIPGLTLREVKAATNAAYNAHEKFRADTITAGERALAYARENGHPVVVLACRPYHIDPEINHGIDQLLTSLGFVILTEDCVSHYAGRRAHNVLNQWTYHARMYNAARFVAGEPDMEMVQLVSFGCGLDAVTTDEVRDILRHAGKLYTQIKIDEISNLGAAKIRLRSLSATMHERREAAAVAR